MSWVTVTPDDILSRLSSPEFDGVGITDLAEGQDSPVDVGIALALAEVRGYIPEALRSDDLTLVPPELQDTAIVIAIEKISSRLSGADLVMTETRTRSLEFAIQRLRDTARGAYHITPGVTTAVCEGVSADGESIVGGNSAFGYGGEAKLDF